MTIIIRKLDKTKHEYLAYTKSLCGKATYFILFEDNILGAVTLHNFDVYYRQSGKIVSHKFLYIDL